MADSSPSIEALSDELLEFVKPELHPGERLLWAAVSKPRQSVRGSTVVTALAVALAGFGLSGFQFYVIFGPTRPRYLSWENVILGSALFLALTGIIAAIVALYTWVSYQAERTSDRAIIYALSDRRAVIWRPVQGTQGVQVYTYLAGTFNRVHRLEYPDGSGDVYFDGIDSADPDQTDFTPDGFLGIDEVRRVEDLARRILVRVPSDS